MRRIRLGRLHRHGGPSERAEYSREVQELVDAADQRIEVPDPLPWIEPRDGEKPVLLVPAADYHMEELVPLAVELEGRGIRTNFAVGESPWDRTRRALSNYPGLDLYWLPAPEEVARDVSLVITLKDTGSMTSWVKAVRDLGVMVIGKVEGAQDFWDDDTPDPRRPYRNLDLVLCQGAFDSAALEGLRTEVVGSSRLERLRQLAPTKAPDHPMALINLNFVYGVRSKHRTEWLNTATAACKAAGIPYLVSVHPAEKSALGPHMTRQSASVLLQHCSVLISRFSTVPFEALAMAVPFVYHNPDIETVRTFSEPDGSFMTSRSQSELGEILVTGSYSDFRDPELSDPFFSRIVSIDPDFPSETRTANMVLRARSTPDRLRP